MINRLCVVFPVGALVGAFYGEISYLASRSMTTFGFGILMVAFGVAVLVALRMDGRDCEYRMDRDDEQRAAAALPPLPRQRVEEGAG